MDENEAQKAREQRMDEAEAEVDYGTSWLFREPGAPNPLTIEATDWSSGMTKLGSEVDFLKGVDRNGQKWSLLVARPDEGEEPNLLRKRLVLGLVEEWDDDTGGFVVTQTLGQVQPGEIVSIKYTGDAQSARGFDYPTFKVSRKPPVGQAVGSTPPAAQAEQPAGTPPTATGEQPAGTVCGVCGFLNGNHQAGCPDAPAPPQRTQGDDIPF